MSRTRDFTGMKCNSIKLVTCEWKLECDASFYLSNIPCYVSSTIYLKEKRNRYMKRTRKNRSNCRIMSVTEDCFFERVKACFLSSLFQRFVTQATSIQLRVQILQLHSLRKSRFVELSFTKRPARPPDSTVLGRIILVNYLVYPASIGNYTMPRVLVGKLHYQQIKPNAESYLEHTRTNSQRSSSSL